MKYHWEYNVGHSAGGYTRNSHIIMQAGTPAPDSVDCLDVVPVKWPRILEEN